ncbi:MAG TPA: DUF1572 family protein [Tepidisphaeraceae bacterium]|nr:DUF1572 family protein [Tepidisphaeraceae bacterium]
MDEVSDAFLHAARGELSKSLHKITHCLNQLNDEQIWHRPAAEMNSIANILIHLCGNLRQWIICGVGGANDVRNRQAEFDDRSMRSKKDLLAEFSDVIRQCDAVLAKVDRKNLLEMRRIQGFDVQLLGAIFSTCGHLQGHVQEIIHITRMQKGTDYQFDFVPKGKEQGGT